MKIEFRFPGSAEYSYASLWTTEGSPGDNARELRDVDDDLLLKVGDVLKRGCAMTAIAVLSPQIVVEESPWQPEEAQNGAQAYQAPQAYQSAPPAWQPPQEAAQPPQQAWQTQQQAWQAPQQQQAPQGPPPGPIPTCAHGPKKWVPAGLRKSDGNPYSAFWACQAPRGMPKCK